MNKRTRHLSLAALILLPLAALLSCTEGPVGIFASIAAETDINIYATKAFKGTSPAFVARLGTDYYAGIGELYKRAESATSWTKASTNGLPGTGPFFATSGAMVNGILYATFVDTATSVKLGVKYWDGTQWQNVDFAVALAADEYVHGLLAADNANLFVTTAIVTTDVDGEKTTAHSLYSKNNTPATDFSLEETSITGLPSSIAVTGGTYWFSAGTQVLSGAVGAIASVTLETAQPTTVPFGGVVANGTQIIFVGRNGVIYDRNGGTWLTSPVFKNTLGLTYSFGIPAFIDDGVNEILLVPGENYPTAGNTKPAQGGYLEFDAAAFSAASASATDYGLAADINNYFITLDAKSVKQIVSFAESGGKFRLFALTNGDGLWSNQFNGTTWSGWRRE